MSAQPAAGQGRRSEDRQLPGVWQPAGPPGSELTCRHGGCGPGTLDEGARRLSHEELAVAHALVSEGHRVRSLREKRGGGRQADLEVCGRSVEVKAFDPWDDRARAPGPNSVLNKLLDASGQAKAVVLYGRGSGLTAGVATAGVARLGGHPRGGSLQSVRVLGDGFDLAWVRTPGLSRDRRTIDAASRRPSTVPDPGRSRRSDRGLSL